MGIIEKLIQFKAGTKALASEVNQNFETLLQGHNNHENRVNTLESSVISKLDTSGGELSGAIKFSNPETIDITENILTLSNNSNSFIVTGPSTISKIQGWNKGIAIIRWESSRILENSSELILQNKINRITSAGDVGIYEFTPDSVREINYFSNITDKTNNFKAQTILSCPKNQQGYAEFIKKLEFSQDIIPTMTSNTHAECEISVSSQYDAINYLPWKTCDDTNATINCWLTQNGVPTGWFKLNFTNPKKAVGLSITSRNSTDAGTASPKDFLIEASDDDINYVFLGSWTNITGWLQNEKRFFAFPNPNNYKYYKITILTNSGATYTGMGELELFAALNDILPNNLKIDCNSDNPVIGNFSKGYNLNGKINEIGIIQEQRNITNLPDNTLTFIGAEKNQNGTVDVFNTTACPSYTMSKQKYSDFNSIPRMYSFTNSYEFTSGYTASSSSMSAPPTGQAADYYGAWRAFDKSPAYKWMASVVGGNQYLQIDFPNSRKAARFGIKASGDLPDQTIKNGFIKGWNGTSWVILATITNQINWIAYETRFFDAELICECSKFKLEIVEIQNMARLAGIAEFEIYELAHCYVIPENTIYLFNPENNSYEEKQVIFLGKP